MTRLLLIDGLQYIPDFIDWTTHDRLLADVDRQPWLSSVDHGVQIYGHTYNHGKRVALRIGEFPTWAEDLAGRLWREGLLPAIPDQLVANEYRPGSGIFGHVDPPALGDAVVSVSLGSTCVMRFSHTQSERVEELFLEPRSALVLSGAARWAWKHAIPERTVDIWQGMERPRQRRVSLTFRLMPGFPARGDGC